MKNGIFTAVAISICLHILIIILVTLVSPNPLKAKKPVSDKRTIKSFLYQTPKAIAKRPKVAAVEPKTTQSPATKIEQHQANEVKTIKEEIVTPTEEGTKVERTEKHNNLNNPITDSKIEKHSPKVSEQAKTTDSYSRLQRLRSQLNQQAQTYSNYNTNRGSPSVFNPSPQTVPHSVPVKDLEQERKLNTKNMGSGIAIAKGDDGTCSITQDMSVYGLNEGSSTQHFSCGESKFDKSFRKHMEKVREKMGKK